MTPDEKKIEEAASEHAGWKNVSSSSLTDSVKFHLTMLEKSFKAGVKWRDENPSDELEKLRTTNAKLVERHNEDLEIIAGLEEKLRIANERAIDSLNVISEMERDKNNRYGAPSGGEKMIEVVIKNEEKSS